jgi:hypothetical protein
VVATITAAVIAAAVPFDRYHYYDLLDDPLTAVGLGTAGAVLLLGAAALVAIRAARSDR